jgi:chemotaxis protein MotB
MAARRRREEEHEEHENHERWLVTYADMITLLMVLFIVLYAIGQTDLKKFEQLRRSLNNSFGGGKASVVAGSNGMLEGAGPKPVAASEEIVGTEAELAQVALEEKRAKAKEKADEDGQLEAAKEQIEARLRAIGLGDAVHFRREGRGLVVTVASDRVLFESGSATLSPEGRVVLDGLVGPLAALPNAVAVEGHTDDRPVRGTFGSNWELSTARATSVLRYLLEVHRFPGDRLSAAGYADEKPVVPNDSDAHRAENRRVELVVMSTFAGTEGGHT